MYDILYIHGGNMTAILSAPGKFIVGNGEIGNLAEHVLAYGSPLLLIAHPDDSHRVAASLEKIETKGIKLIHFDFKGECTHSEIDRAGALCQETGAKAVIGLGGGKAIDTAKAAAQKNNLPSVIIPTIVSNDAPCSKLAIVYNENHVFAETLVLPKNPDLVLVDSGVIAQAPERFLVAGMGDAYATYFEARACVRSCALNYNKGGSTRTAMVLAEECRRILLADGERALLACRSHSVIPALENIIEANVLLSGIGFESVGLAAAHALDSAFTILPETHKSLHGEKVAIGTLAQLIMENAPDEELMSTLRFYKSIGLPTSLAQIGITEGLPEKLRGVANRIMNSTVSPMHNMPFPVSENMIIDALMYVNCLDKLLD